MQRIERKSKYKIINSDGYVLLTQYEIAGEMVLGYGGVWGTDHRSAKKFKTLKECQDEVNRMPHPAGTKYLVVETNENWRKIYNRYKRENKL